MHPLHTQILGRRYSRNPLLFAAHFKRLPDHARHRCRIFESKTPLLLMFACLETRKLKLLLKNRHIRRLCSPTTATGLENARLGRRAPPVSNDREIPFGLKIRQPVDILAADYPRMPNLLVAAGVHLRIFAQCLHPQLGSRRSHL